MGTKISQLGTATTITASDLIQVVDFEDKAMASTGTNKKITAATLGNNLPVTATGSSASRSLKDRFADTVNVKDFGAVGDGVTDDTAAIQAAIDSVASKGGGVIDCTGGRWLIDSASLVVKNGVTLMGPWNNLGETDNQNYSTLKSVFILNPSYTIRLAEEFSAVKGMGIFRKGLIKPNSLLEAETVVASFAGTAITVGNGTSKAASDTYVGYCFVLGFQYAYYCDYNERPRIEYLSGDNLNGVYLNRVYDMNHMVGCHFWPYITTHQSWTTSGDAGLRRQGIGYYFGTGVDWGQATNCFSYGYDTGFEVNGSDNVVLLNCGQDGWKNNNTYSVGYKASGTTKNLNLVSCKSAAKNTSVLIDLSGGGTSQCVKITGGNLWACSTSTGSHVYLKRGNCIVTAGVSMFDGPVGVKTDSTAGSITVTNNIFQSIGTPYSIAIIENSVVHSNIFNGSVDSTTGAQFLFDNQNARFTHTAVNTSGTNDGWHSKQAAGSITSLLASPNGAQAGKTTAHFYDGTAFQPTGSSRFTLRQTPSAGSVAGAFIVSTTPSATVSPVDRLILNESGHFYPLSDNAYTLGVTGARWSAIWAANGVIQTSDERTKTSIETSQLGLDFINDLQPVSYKFSVGGNKVIRQVYRDAEGNEVVQDAEGATPSEIITEEVEGQRTHYGLLAQQVKSVLPEGADFGGWILTDKDDPESQQGLRYEEFIAPMIKAIQELSAKVALLEAQ